MNLGSIFTIILGAVLAIFTSFATRLLTDWRENRVKTIRLKRFLDAELPRCLSRIESLINIYNQSHTIEPSLITALDRSIKLFKSRREDSYLLESEVSFQVLEFYDTVEQAVEMIFSMLHFSKNSQYQDYSLQEIRKQIEELEGVLELGRSLVSRYRKFPSKRQHALSKTK